RRILSVLAAEQLSSAYFRAVIEEKYPQFEKLLDSSHDAQLVNHVQYAAYWLLRGQLPQRIEHFRSHLSKHPNDKWSAAALVYLHRANGDLAAARKVAEKAGNDELLDGLLLEAADWKSLSLRAENPKEDKPADNGIHHIPGADNPAEKWAFRAAFARLAGRRDKFDNAVAELKKFAESPNDADQRALVAARALLLNDRPKDGLALLRSVKNDTLLFDVLCARLEFDEALKLPPPPPAARGGGLGFTRQDTLDFNKARILRFLGKKDEAQALFARFDEKIKEGVNPYWVYKLLLMESRAGLKDLALQHCAKMFGILARQNAAQVRIAPTESMYLSQVFTNKQTAAETWWLILRKRFKDESALAVLK
ncbi:MAG: hypothetical protein ACRELF_27105, partial [Gemmataceae bacterium]